ncbi:MAG TPA: GNAT family N-acetyltransferase [Arenimonas sp.]|nr:GNAT family N-acetyltransferase [Arenimonas sp.]
MNARARPAAASVRPKRADRVRLRDGRELWIRPIVPPDAAPIAAGFKLLTDEEVRRRFLHPIKELSAEHLRKLVHPEPGREYALVAAELLPPGEALVPAVARLSRSEGQDDAEFALLVSHFVAGQGLGRRLLQRLIDWARRNGIRELWGHVLDDNTPMLQLAERMGFTRRRAEGAPGIVRVSLRLPPG